MTDNVPTATEPTPGFDLMSIPEGASEASLLLDPRMFEHAQRVAKVYASSDIVPQQYRGNIANCVIAMELATRMQVNVFMLMQNSYVVQGRPGFEAKLAISLANKRGPFQGPIQWKFERDGAKITACTAYATHKNGEVYDATVSWEMVQAEGWSTKGGSKWKTMPEQMFKYRSAVFLIRAVCPEVLLGMHTTDELEDTYGDTRYIPSESTVVSPAQRQSERIKQAQTGEQTPQQPEPEPEQPVEPGDEAEPATEPSEPEAPQEPASGEETGKDEQTSPVDQLGKAASDAVSLLANKVNVTLDEAYEALEKWARKKHKKALRDLQPNDIAGIRIDIKAGDVKV